MPRASVLLALPAIALVKTYQFTLSPLMGRGCRFHPTCSWYMLGALREHGLFRGGWMGAKRLCRCHPFHPGGYDPVPPTASHG
ncbi:MAG TPA: membrane protein insertion efficiency factor YidD [Phycisphaerales bacterium]|nr:membrane protein insertion efficiency factor YidD [Phycisphaerales bacterium]